MIRKRLTCPECDGGLDGGDLAYGLVCPACGIRVAGPFDDGHKVPDYVSIYEKPAAVKKSPAQLDAEIAGALRKKPGRVSKTARNKLRTTLARVVKEMAANHFGRMDHRAYQRAGEDAIKISGLYGRAAAQSGDDGVEIFEIVDGEPHVDQGAFVQWSADDD